jgi:F0F1-type ATP synthase delta subunit
MNSIKDVIATTFERDSLTQFLDQFDQIIFNSQFIVKNFIAEKLQSPLAEFVCSYLTQSGEGSDALFAQSKRLRQEVAGLPVITLTVPFRVDQQIASGITAKAREVTGLPVLVELKIDKSLIGGAVVEGNGRVGEYSFRRYFEKRKEKQDGL